MYREIIKARLSEQTRKTRRKLGWSQERMSERLRITVRAYGDLERGKYCFSTFALLFLFELMGKEGSWELVRAICDEIRETESAGNPGSQLIAF
jgi:hypothetical protein